MNTKISENSLADDRLCGAKAIGDFIGESEKRVYYLAERGYLPVGKLGATLIGSKAALREQHERLTRRAIEAPAPTPSRLNQRPPRRDRRPRPAEATPDAR
jgi:hypothetical protein